MQAMLRFGAPFFLAGAFSAAPAFADQFGNPTVVGQPGSVEVSIGGGRASSFTLDSDRTTAVTTVGNISNTNPVPPGSTTYKEDQVFGRVSYTINSQVQVSALFGSGKDTAQKSSSFGLGLKLLPGQSNGDVKMGMMLRAQRVRMEVQGPWTLSPPYSNVSDGVSTSSVRGTLDGTDSLQYMQYDMFLGVSTATGMIRPYGGFALTKITGTDTTAFSGNPTTWTCSAATGLCNIGTTAATLNSKANISGNRLFSGIVGLDINPESALGLTIEGRWGTQKLMTVAGNMRF